jgi:hypothetical protein
MKMRAGLHRVLDVLVDVCLLKADHLQANWQDYAAAKEWEQAGQAINSVRASDTVRRVS